MVGARRSGIVGISGKFKKFGGAFIGVHAIAISTVSIYSRQITGEWI